MKWCWLTFVFRAAGKLETYVDVDWRPVDSCGNCSLMTARMLAVWIWSNGHLAVMRNECCLTWRHDVGACARHRRTSASSLQRRVKRTCPVVNRTSECADSIRCIKLGFHCSEMTWHDLWHVAETSPEDTSVT